MVDESTVSGLVRVDPAHAVFDGHFPAKKVVPGVVMLDIIGGVLSQHIERDVQLNSAAQIKYPNLWLPDVSPEGAVTIRLRDLTSTEVSIVAEISHDGVLFCTCKASYA